MDTVCTPIPKDRAFLVILSISLAVFMSTLDGTIVNIALPTISEAFALSSATVSWVSTIYLLIMAGCVLVFGKVADAVGFRKVFLAGFVIFTLGSLACGVLPDLFHSFLLLVASRACQAVGGAMITAIAPAMVTAFIPLDERGKAMGIVMTVAGIGTAVGPVIGGALTQYLSWHWIFFINVPVGIVAVLLGSRVIPASCPATSTLAGFDRAGSALIFTGLATLLFAVSEGHALGWTSPPVLAAMAVAACSLAAFVRHELAAPDPVLELRLFADRFFLVPNLILALVFFSFSGINYLLPFYLEYVKGLSASSAGLVLTALSVAMMAAGIIAGALFNRTGPRPLCIAAGFLLAAGYFLLTFLSSTTGTTYVIVALLAIGLGLGLMLTPVSNMVMNSVARKYQGMVSSLTSLERFAPMTLGIAVFNAVFVHGVIAIAGHAGVTREAPKEIQLQVLATGFDFTFTVTFIVSLVILALACAARQHIHPDYTDDGTAGPSGGLL